MKTSQEMKHSSKVAEPRFNPLKTEIGSRMRQLRKHLDLTQAQMVVNFRTGRAHYSRLENGEIFPGPDMLKFLRLNYDVSLDWLILGKGDMFLTKPKPVSKPAAITKRLIQAEIPEREAQEIKELLDYMQKFPMIKHSILGFYWEYRVKNRKLIDEMSAQQKTAGEG